jgi:hypothetical protein
MEAELELTESLLKGDVYALSNAFTNYKKVRTLLVRMFTKKTTDMFVCIGGKNDYMIECVHKVVEEFPEYRDSTFFILSGADVIRFRAEYDCRELEARQCKPYKPNHITFLVSSFSYELACFIDRQLGDVVDGDTIVKWPTQKRFWEHGDYSPFKNRGAMLKAHDRMISRHMKHNPKDVVLFNPGSDFVDMYKVDGMVRVSNGELKRNIASRIMADPETPNPTDPIESISEQQRMLDYAHRTGKIPQIYEGWDDPRLRSARGLIVAASGAGKTTFVKRMSRTCPSPSGGKKLRTCNWWNVDKFLSGTGKISVSQDAWWAFETVFFSVDVVRKSQSYQHCMSTALSAQSGAPPEPSPEAEAPMSDTQASGEVITGTFATRGERVHRNTKYWQPPQDIVKAASSEVEKNVRELDLHMAAPAKRVQFKDCTLDEKQKNAAVDVLGDIIAKCADAAAKERKADQKVTRTLKSRTPNSWTPPGLVSPGECPLVFKLAEGIDYLNSKDWVRMLYYANTPSPSETAGMHTFAALQKKAGSCGIIINPESELDGFNSVFKDIDPNAVQIGKMNNKLCAFTEKNVLLQRTEVHPDQLEQKKYPRNFAEAFFYLMMGSAPWDVTKLMWPGVVPQMVNASAGQFNPRLLSTSTFGKLYRSTNDVISIVPLFPELISRFAPHMEATAVVTKFDFALGYMFRVRQALTSQVLQGMAEPRLREYEWVLAPLATERESKGVVEIGRKRPNPKIYDVTNLPGICSYAFDQGDSPHITFDSVPVKEGHEISPGTLLPILSFEFKDGARLGHVLFNGVKGRITLRPIDKGSSIKYSTVDTERCCGYDYEFPAHEACPHHARLTHVSKISSNDVVFRAGERVNEGYFIYFWMVNAGLMGTGKIPKRMSVADIIQKARRRVFEGVDTSGHLLLGASLPRLYQFNLLASILINMYYDFDGVGIYYWEGLPVGRWHTKDDYFSAVNYGLHEKPTSNYRKKSFQMFSEFFSKIDAAEPGDKEESSPYLLSNCRTALRKMFSS